MNISIAVVIFLLTVFASISLNGIMRNIAKNNRWLIDIPDKNRKFHLTPTPVTGGIAIQIAMLTGFLALFFLADFTIQSEIRNLPLTSNTINDGDFHKKSLKLENSDQNEIFDLLISETQSNNESDFEVQLQGSDEVVEIKMLENGVFRVNNNGNFSDYVIQNGNVVSLASDVTESYKFSGSKPFEINKFVILFIIFGLLLQAFTLVDDAWGINPKIRITFQVLLNLLFCLASGIYVNDIGFGVGNENIQLGFLGIPFTVFCVTGIINAFNMIDGINGLCASMVISALIGFIIITGLDVVNYAFVIAFGGIFGFLVYNLGVVGEKRRVFLGDNGSSFLGFFVAWACIYLSSAENNFFNPVTALWLVFIPFLDCMNVILQRMRRGKKLFSPDRNHLHHLLMKREINPLTVLSYIFLISLFFVFIGISLDYFGISASISLLLFLISGSIYLYFTQRLSE